MEVFREDKWAEVSELRLHEAQRFNKCLYQSPVKKFTPRAERVGRVKVIYTSNARNDLV